jgi:hypothetical protein
MSEYTDYFLARAPSADELTARLAQAEIPCLIVDDASATPGQATTSSESPWWVVLAADLTDVAPPRGRASRAEPVESLAPLVTDVSPLLYRRNIVRELCEVVPALLHFTAAEGAAEWSLQLWTRGSAELAELNADWSSDAAVRGVLSDATLAPFASVLGVHADAVRAYVTPGPGSAAAFAVVAQLPWLPMLVRHTVPAASWLYAHGTAVRTRTLVS